MKPTGSVLERYFDYSPDTGEFRWRISRASNASVGDLAGCIARDGYVQIYVNGRPYKAHVLAWVWMTGEWPIPGIDHRDLNRTNNRWVNLRAASQSENGANCKKRATNTSGFKGVCFCKKSGRWIAQIQVNRKCIHLGSHPTPEAAAFAYAKGAQLHFGEFARIA